MAIAEWKYYTILTLFLAGSSEDGTMDLLLLVQVALAQGTRDRICSLSSILALQLYTQVTAVAGTDAWYSGIVAARYYIWYIRALYTCTLYTVRFVRPRTRACGLRCAVGRGHRTIEY